MFGVIAVSWFLVLGWVPVQEDITPQKTYGLDKDYVATVAEIGLTAKVGNRLTLSGSWENFQYAGPAATGLCPYRANYKAGASFKIVEGMTLNVSHECDHPVIFWREGYADNKYQNLQTMVFIRFEGGD